jgi:hypothetical protein
MRKFIAVTLCLCAFAMVANAAVNRIEFYFSKQSTVTGIPAEYTAGTVPTVAIGEKAYLWAYVQGTSARWSYVSLYFNGAPCTSGTMYDPFSTDPDDPETTLWRRWSNGVDLNPIGDNVVNMVGVPVSPVSGLGDGTNDYLSTARHFLLGEVDFGEAGNVYLNVGAGFIVKVGTGNPPTDDIYFGFAGGAGSKEHIVKQSGGLAYGSDVGASTATADLYVIPEPASLLLIGIAGLALRRR